VVLIILSAAWAVGLYLGYLIELPPLLMLLGFAPLPLLLFKRTSRKKIIVAALGIFLLVSGSVYSYNSQNHIVETRVSFYNDTGATEIRGMVALSPDIRDKSTRLLLEVSSIKLDSGWRDVSGKALVFVPRYPEFEYGDIVQIQGEPVTPPQLDDFDYQGYLEHQGIYTTLAFPQIRVLEKGRGFTPLAWIYRLRASLARSLAEALPEPQAALAQGILLGLRGNIPDDLNQEFSRSGTSHLLAISGYNLTVMAGILLAVGVWLLGRKRYLYVWLALGAIWFYTIITGLNPPVVRGAIMASIFLFAEALGRQRSAAAALALAAAIMAGVSPYILGDASFQLSVMAMAGLIFIHPIISGFGKKLIARVLGEERWYVTLTNLIADMFSVSIAAIIAVWPLIAYYFGVFSWAGPLATFLLTFIQPFIIVIGMAAALLGLITPIAGQIFGWVLWPFLAYMIAVVQWLGTSASVISVDWINPIFIGVYYLVLALLIMAYERRQKAARLLSGASGLMKAGVSFSFGVSGKMKWIAVLLLLIAVLTTFTAATMPDSNLRVSFLDVGEGDAILVQKGSTQVLIEGGPSPQSITLALSKQMPFWDRTIDAVILTHPHQDHLAGLTEVLRRYKVKKVIMTGNDYSSPVVEEWRALLKEKGVQTVIADNSGQINMGDVAIKIVNPSAGLLIGTESDVDNNSMAVVVQVGDISFLLTGDMMKEAERNLVWNRADIDCTVLKVAHHGSDTSSTPEFLATASPQIAVISSGADNKFGHPKKDILERLEGRVGEANLYRTDLQGTISFITDGEKLWVETER
jgi:competence protein ComEC